MLLLWPAALAFCKPLTDQEIQKAKKIVVVLGTFDPVHNGDLAAAEKIVKEGGADAVLLMPVTPPTTQPGESAENRVRLIERAAMGSEVLSYPQSSGLQTAYLTQAAYQEEALLREIRRINPSIQIEVRRRDAANDKLSADIQENLRLEPGFYGDSKRMRDGPHALAVPEEVGHFIQSHAVYLNSIRLPPLTEEEVAIRKETVLIYKELEDRRRGGGAAVKKKYAEALASKDVKELNLGGKVYPVIKWIGSGSVANAYLVKDGDRVLVAKIANHLSESAELSRQTVAAHIWLAKNGSLRTADLVAYDPTGAWILTSFVQGPTLTKWLRANPNLSPEQDSMLRDFYEKTREIQRVSNLHLDIAPDNIIMERGVPVLVDTGPLPLLAVRMLFANNADEAISRWKGAAVAAKEADEITPSLNEILCRFDYGRLKPYR